MFLLYGSRLRMLCVWLPSGWLFEVEYGNARSCRFVVLNSTSAESMNVSKLGMLVVVQMLYALL